MGEQTEKKIVLEIEAKEVRVMIGILIQYQSEHPDNHKVATLIDQIIDQFDRCLTQQCTAL